MPQNGHSTVYRKTSASTAKSFRKASMERELADWTEAIKAAESHDVALKLLSEKQAAQQDLLPSRRSPELSKEAEPDQIADSGLRVIYEKSEAAEGLREARQAEPVKKPARTGSYAHGSSMKLTIEKVCGRPDVTSKAKFIAMILSAHWPHVRPPIERLMVLTGFGKSTIVRGLAELRKAGLLNWKRGKSRVANEYTCLWLDRHKTVRRFTVNPRTDKGRS